MEIVKKRILITGGAGYLGTYLANYLMDKGFVVRMLDVLGYNRSDYQREIEFVKGDVRDYDLVCDTVKDVEYIVHTAALPAYGESKNIYSVAIQGISNVLKAAEKNRIERVVYMSSTAIYGFQAQIPIEETASCCGFGPHAESKIIAESICDIYRKEGMVVSVLRPRPMVGPGRLGVFQILFDWVGDNRKIPVIGSGANRCQLLDIEDLSEAVSLVLSSSKEKANNIFNVGAEQFGTFRQDLTEFIHEVGSASELVSFPAGPVKCILRILNRLNLSPLYEGAFGIIDKDLNVSVDKIKRVLGWSAKKSNAQSLTAAYRWYQENYNEQAFKNVETNRGTLKQGILRFIKKIF